MMMHFKAVVALVTSKTTRVKNKGNDEGSGGMRILWRCNSDELWTACTLIAEVIVEEISEEKTSSRYYDSEQHFTRAVVQQDGIHLCRLLTPLSMLQGLTRINELNTIVFSVLVCACVLVCVCVCVCTCTLVCVCVCLD